jgi:hypothetical protein
MSRDVFLSFFLPIYLSICLSVCLCLPIYLPTVSIYLPIFYLSTIYLLSICLPTYVPTHLSIYLLSIYLSIYNIFECYTAYCLSVAFPHIYRFTASLGCYILLLYDPCHFLFPLHFASSSSFCSFRPSVQQCVRPYIISHAFYMSI